MMFELMFLWWAEENMESGINLETQNLIDNLVSRMLTRNWSKFDHVRSY
jgi:hypothetical protein